MWTGEDILASTNHLSVSTNCSLDFLANALLAPIVRHRMITSEVPAHFSHCDWQGWLKGPNQEVKMLVLGARLTDKGPKGPRPTSSPLGLAGSTILSGAMRFQR